MHDVQAFVDGQWADGESTSVIVDKFDSSVVGRLHHASAEQVQRATRGLAEEHSRRVLAPYERFQVLSRAAALLRERKQLFVATIVADTGFSQGDAEREAARGEQTLLLCAEEAKRVHGEVVPIDGAPNVTDRLAFTIRKPIGVVCCITPFNSPLNTLLHKVGPAIAAGNAVIVKPSTYTPATAKLVVELLTDAGFPARLIALVFGPGGTVGEWLLRDPVPGYYAFTGSTGVGTHILQSIGLRKSQLELGSLASTIVCDDADLDRAVPSCANAAFRKAGQVCTSVQRLYVQEGVFERFVSRFAERAASMRAGDPRDPATSVGPLISLSEAERVESWIKAALDLGATAAVGGRRSGTVVEPTVLLNADPKSRVMTEEVFGPVVCIQAFGDLDEAISGANDTPFGLASGIFTRSIRNGMLAAQQLRVGSVHINETSNGRVDLMPYGGVKDSGMGREGPRYAIAEMTEERLVTMAW
jgi:acyl-CoA reductase-like NAD-dependent aldehyde dehydrogenase